MTTAEILELLNGCEVYAPMTFEGTVGVSGKKIFRDGEELEYTDEDVQELWEEYVEGEGLC